MEKEVLYPSPVVLNHPASAVLLPDGSEIPFVFVIACCSDTPTSHHTTHTAAEKKGK